VHDVSDGGLLVAVAEMALAGGIGVSLRAPPARLAAHAYWFGEDQGRYVLAVAGREADGIVARAKALAIPQVVIGRVEGDRIAIEGEGVLTLAKLRKAHESWLPGYMAE
jgi:phosphoribosylformylglycinamidine synthase